MKWFKQSIIDHINHLDYVREVEEVWLEENAFLLKTTWWQYRYIGMEFLELRIAFWESIVG
ncbi:hypothetical protein KAR91_39445 [Candidatus Pacearchaeota archaeon]|nr:hypothetical protein [Candidatus Pacearchaeota archaeon]